MSVKRKVTVPPGRATALPYIGRHRELGQPINGSTKRNGHAEAGP
jgi:hypothetical protein